MREAQSWRVRRDAVLDADQVVALERILGAASDRPAALLFRFLLRLPLRVSEALALRRQDFVLDRTRPFVRVHRLKKRDPKRPPDELPVPRDLLDELRAWSRNLASTSAIFWRDRPGGAAISKFGAIRRFRKFCAAAGISLPARCAVHILRHTAATQLLRITKDLRLVQELLGHASPTITAGYTHVAFEDADRAVSDLWSRR